MKALCSALVSNSGTRRGHVASMVCRGVLRLQVVRTANRWAQKESVDNVHTFHLGLPRSAAGLAWIPHVSPTSQCLQGLESRSSPTSGTAYPLVRGGFCFNVFTFCLVRSL